MVAASLSFGALVGVLLSGGFVWWEVGRYATPQVPATLFDERRELFAYTAGLFVGVPLALAAVLFLDSMSNAALIGGVIFLASLLALTEVAQWAFLRSRFWGRGESRPFYVLGYRAAIGGIIGLAVVAQYLSNPTITVLGVGVVLTQAVAILGLEVAGALVSIPARAGASQRGGGPVSGVLIGGVGFFLLGIGEVGGELTALAGALLAALGAAMIYRRLRTMLATIPPPSAAAPPLPSDRRPAFGRTSEGEPGTPKP